MPELELLSQEEPFTALLEMVREQLEKGLMAFPRIQTRKIARIGIVSTTFSAHEDLPPGIQTWVEGLARPWEYGLDAYVANLTGVLRDNDESKDRCIHQITKHEDEEELARLSFDWQRSFKERFDYSEHRAHAEIKTAIADALEYFEELGDGRRFS